MRVLIVDDEHLQRQLMSIMLAHLGHSSAEAANIADALTALERDSFDVMTIDIRLDPTGEDGIELLQMVRARWPQQRAVIISGFINPHAKVRAEAAGAEEIISKPVTMADFKRLFMRLSI